MAQLAGWPGTGFSNLGQGTFGVDVFLACVYAVYMYTVFRVKYRMNLIESSQPTGVDTPGIRGAENGVLINV